ncbi:YcjF family protein [Hyphomicrobium facile]|uniref:Putative membrane protein n=1 Tax=Hyphomicrobium facile TaxID=51670 RepID=A0A1I7NV50_9HYPH|nr:TIGR01620 family protein [Hyphomicrobium facile]SFV38545.1 putative membrane protein [Hyphomicrobium facile]
MTFENDQPPPRKPRVFTPDDIADEPELDDDISGGGAVTSRRASVPAGRLTVSDINRGFRFGSILFSAMAALASLAAGVWFTRFVSIALERQDWVGWVAFGLMTVIALALLGIVLRELLGFRRLARLAKLRALVRDTIAKPNLPGERKAVAALLAHYRGRPDLAWGLARVKDHTGDVLEPGELLRLADRELLRPIDAESRRVILKSAKRVATVTALSPIMWIAMGFVLVENVRMFRALAGLYGGRPGVLGALRLARLVVGHIIATGGIAMTDDLLGQFVGQDVLRRLSRRLGEGAFNGALTSRLGVVAVEVIRPLPYLDAEPLRVREIFNELLRSLRGSDKSEKQV